MKFLLLIRLVGVLNYLQATIKFLYSLDHKGVYVEGRQSLSSEVNGSLKLVTLPAAEEGFCTGFG